MARKKSRTKRAQKRARTGRMKRSRVSRKSRVSKRSKVSRNNKRTQRRGTRSRRRLRKTRNNRIRVEGGMEEALHTETARDDSAWGLDDQQIDGLAQGDDLWMRVAVLDNDAEVARWGAERPVKFSHTDPSRTEEGRDDIFVTLDRGQTELMAFSPGKFGQLRLDAGERSTFMT
jgi:hypothetical protein